MANLELQAGKTSNNQEGTKFQFYRFPYKRIYDTNGNLTSIPVWVKKIDGKQHWGIRKTNFVENAAMYLADHPALEAVLVFLGTNTVVNAFKYGTDAAFLEGMGALAAVVMSGLTKEMEAQDQGVTPQHAKPVKNLVW